MEKTPTFASTSNQTRDKMQNASSDLNKLSTPEQLLAQYEYARELGWTTEQIELLYNTKIVLGEKNEQILIFNYSFENFLDFVKSQHEEE